MTQRQLSLGVARDSYKRKFAQRVRMFLTQGSTLKWVACLLVALLSSGVAQIRATSASGNIASETRAEFPPVFGQLVNISARGFFGTSVNNLPMIGGFIVYGPDSKKVLIRALGPSLSGVLANDAATNPFIIVRDSFGNIVASNDNWKDSQQGLIAATGLAPADDLESAVVLTLPSGSYTVTALDKSANEGVLRVGLLEIYDIDSASQSHLTNISARGFVGGGENVIIGGFIIGGGAPTGVVVRGIGPSLLRFTIAGELVLLNPTLSLFDANGTLLASNDDWKDTQEAQIEATGLEPSFDRESAIFMNLSPGSYTAIISGIGGGRGQGILEIFNVQ